MDSRPPKKPTKPCQARRTVHTTVWVLSVLVTSCIPVKDANRRQLATLDIHVPAHAGATVHVMGSDLLTSHPGWTSSDDTNGLGVMYQGEFVPCAIIGGRDGRLDQNDILRFIISKQNRHSAQLTYQVVRPDPLVGHDSEDEHINCKVVPEDHIFPPVPSRDDAHALHGAPLVLRGISRGARIDADRVLLARRPGWHDADTVVVLPEIWIPTIQQWIEHRERLGHRIAVLPAESLYALGSGGNPRPELVREAIWQVYRQTRRKLKYVLLIGDVRAHYEPALDAIVPIPTFYRRKVHYPGYTSQHEYPTDAPYGVSPHIHHHRAQLAVGRLPVRTTSELQAAMRKILRYETHSDLGPWQQRLLLFGGPANYGDLAGQVVESHAEHLLSELLPYDWDLHFVFAKPSSPYAFRLDQLESKLVHELGRGALFAAYFGHGAADSFDDVGWRGKTWSIGNSERLAAVSTPTRAPIFFAFTCDSGAYDQAFGQPSLSETMILDPDGPVAVFASSRASHPYPNALYAGALIRSFMHRRPLTLGEGLLDMRHRMETNRIPLAELLVETPIEQLLSEHQELYGLLGDPLLRIQYPETAQVSVQPIQRLNAAAHILVPGEPLGVHAQLPFMEGQLYVTLETDRRALPDDLVPYSRLEAMPVTHALESMAQNHEKVSDKVVSQTQLSFEKYHGVAHLQVPTAPGTYYVRIFAQNRVRSAHASQMIQVPTQKKTAF